MDKLQGIAELLKTLLWDRDVATAADQQPEVFETLLKDIESKISARLIWDRSLIQKLSDGQVNRAKSLINSLNKGSEKKDVKRWKEKASCFKTLSSRALVVAAVLCNREKDLHRSCEAIRAICQSAAQIAEWSPWPDDERLEDSWVPQPDEFQRTVCPPESPVLRCSSCRAALSSREAISTSPNPHSTISESTATTNPVIPTDVTPPARRKRRRTDSGLSPSDETTTVLAPTPLQSANPQNANQAPVIRSPILPSNINVPPNPTQAADASYQPAQAPIFQHNPHEFTGSPYPILHLFAYIREHFPKTIQFTPIAFRNATRYASPIFAGIHFQLTTSWLERQKLPTVDVKVKRSLLLEGIKKHLGEHKSYGFKNMFPVKMSEDLDNLQGLTVMTQWVLGDLAADGVVWPDGFGELVIKWSRPYDIGQFLEWSAAQDI